MGVLDIDLPIFSPEQASQSKLKVVLTRLPFVISGFVIPTKMDRNGIPLATLWVIVAIISSQPHMSSWYLDPVSLAL